MKDYYRILQVSRIADMQEIKKAYRRLAKQYHPDLNRDNPEAATLFREVNEAYEMLSNPEKKELYDRKLAHQEKPAAPKETAAPVNHSFNRSDISSGFEQFFGFHPVTGEFTGDGKNSGSQSKNPLDTSAVFQRFMGFK